MEKDKMIYELDKLKSQITNTLRYCNPEDLPHKPIRMTVLDEDVVLLEHVISFLNNTL